MKWYGTIAFANQEDDGTGVWINKPVLRQYYGDLQSLSKSDSYNDNVNSDITMQNQLSVVADPYLLDSFSKIQYVTLGNSKWKVSSVKVGFPRLILTFGSLYEDEEMEEEDAQNEE